MAPLSATEDAPQNLCVPMKLDAFVFNESACNGEKDDQAKIAPITQPNYTFLRMENSMVQHDVLDFVDLHNSAPSSRNPRITDVGQGITREKRVGVYLHWMVPQPFRSGIAETKSAEKEHTKLERAVGISRQVSSSSSANDRVVDHKAPIFKAIPNRWLIVRVLDPGASTTKPQGSNIEPVKLWVIESDKTTSIDCLDAKVDLQVDVAPYLTTFVREGQADKNIEVDEQAEVFIGSCVDATKWKNPDEDSTDPRVELTAASSSNSLFMDFQYHCGNVFSMVDTFSYDGNKYLEAANASYYVIGWQSDKDKDLMFIEDDPIEAGQIDRLKRLTNLSMKLSDNQHPDADAINEWLKSKKPSRSACHGALYNVEWSRKWTDGQQPPKPKVPADLFAKKMATPHNIAVGTTPIDSILAHVGTHDPHPDLERFIQQIDTYLKAEDESVSGQDVALDEIQNTNFARFDGGSKYNFSDKDLADPSKRPSKEQMSQLMDLNARQALYDSVMRRIQQLQWEVFSIWWKFISDVDNINNKHDGLYKSAADTVKTKLNNLQPFAKDLMKSIQSDANLETTSYITPKKAEYGAFFQQNDPTLLIAGLTSGWPVDFQKTLKVRLDNQPISESKIDDKELQELYFLQCIPDEIRPTGTKLIKEFLSLDSSAKGYKPPSENQVPPLYHDGSSSKTPDGTNDKWRDQWSGTQPWFPLYLEWEAQYYHIPFENWALMERDVATTTTAKRVTFGLTTDVSSGFQEDIRTLRGRTMILPQPSFSLEIRLKRLFQTIPAPVLDKKILPTERDTLLKGLNALGYLSSPLAGLNDHLATRFTGNHIKPLVRIPGYEPTPLADAMKAAANIELDEQWLRLIDTETGPTPYGSLVPLTNDKIIAFKPVTHGQLRFTSLNVIDKFGQAVHAVDPLKETTKPIIPAVGEYYEPQPSKNNKTPNVVDPTRSTLEHDEFIQLPPSINQPARLNSEFVIKDPIGGVWRPANTWENPIWGWVVINFADNGLQFFTQDGTFYREVRVSEGKSNNGEKWLPFEPPKNDSEDVTQLDSLITEMTLGKAAKTYLGEFMDMLQASVGRVDLTPDAYGQFMNSLVGKPLALVNMGWCLELNANACINQSTHEGQKSKLPRGLLPDNGVTRYEFPIKFGNKDRSHDGLIGYFFTQDGDQTKLDLTKCYTYYGSNLATNPNDPNAPLHLLTKVSARYPKFFTNWIDPEKYIVRKEYSEAGKRYEEQRSQNLRIFGAVVDPFLPINAYTGILPIKSLKLPTWTWETELKKMTTFIHAGPVIITENMPEFDSTKRLGDSYDLKNTNGTMLLPSLQVADWAWLQPYDAEKDRKPTALHEWERVMADDDEKNHSVYVPFEIGRVDTNPTSAKGPYTAVEGYMQLRAPIEQGLPPKKDK